MAERDGSVERADRARHHTGPTAPVSEAWADAMALVVELGLETERLGCTWWQTEASDTIADLNGTGATWPAVLAQIVRVLREGVDPEVIIGRHDALAALAVAQEWVDARVDPSDVAGWLRAGCWRPSAARALSDAGIAPRHLLDSDSRPLHWVDVPTPDGESLPLARAVAEEFETVESALRLMVRRVS